VIFWDASAIVPLLVAERTTRRMQALAGRDFDMLVWWGSEGECVSALARLERAAALDVKGMALASNRLKQLANGWHEIEPSEIVRESALRFLRVRWPSQPRNIVPHRFKSSRLMSVSPTRRARKASRWSI
jgi:uncharacterized protein